MPITTDSIRSDIEARINDVRHEITRLEDAKRALTGPATTSRPAASRDGSRPVRRRRRAKRIPREQRLAQARAAAKANPKITGKQLANELKVSPPYAQRLLGEIRPRRRRRQTSA